MCSPIDVTLVFDTVPTEPLDTSTGGTEGEETTATDGAERRLESETVELRYLDEDGNWVYVQDCEYDGTTVTC